MKKHNDANALIYLLAYVIALTAAMNAIHKGYVPSNNTINGR